MDPILNMPLKEADPEVYELIQLERHRQKHGLELIASENFASRSVLEANGSVFTNKYSEGLPGKRYYGGNQYVDQLENLTIKRALEAFHLSPDVWGCNVQSYSGSTANFNAYTSILQPHDRIMGLDLPSGGHLTHGFQTDKKKISATSVYFESMAYEVNQDGFVDLEALERDSAKFRPKLIIIGASAYPRDWDYKKFRDICDKRNCYMLADVAHISGLIAGGEAANAFEYCDLVTTTTHKTLRGPRAAIIFFRKIKLDGSGPTDLEERVNSAVFPGLQGGPHNNTIAAVCTALKQVCSPMWVEYVVQVKKNAKALAEALKAHGYKIQTDGTDNHLILWDLKPQDITGSKFEKILEKCEITTNKNTVRGDKSAMAPGGVRLGTPALTSRGFKEADFVRVAEYLHKAVLLAVKIQTEAGKPLANFIAALETNEEVKAMAIEVAAWAGTFPIPGDY
jgi:glycine hydroxymethyltransferase